MEGKLVCVICDGKIYRMGTYNCGLVDGTPPEGEVLIYNGPGSGVFHNKPTIGPATEHVGSDRYAWWCIATTGAEGWGILVPALKIPHKNNTYVDQVYVFPGPDMGQAMHAVIVKPYKDGRFYMYFDNKRSSRTVVFGYGSEYRCPEY